MSEEYDRYGRRIAEPPWSKVILEAFVIGAIVCIMLWFFA